MKTAKNSKREQASNKHQRWDRAAYNAYMKFYMQCVRALKSGRAEVWKG